MAQGARDNDYNDLKQNATFFVALFLLSQRRRNIVVEELYIV